MLLLWCKKYIDNVSSKTFHTPGLVIQPYACSSLYNCCQFFRRHLKERLYQILFSFDHSWCHFRILSIDLHKFLVHHFILTFTWAIYLCIYFICLSFEQKRGTRDQNLILFQNCFQAGVSKLNEAKQLVDELKRKAGEQSVLLAEKQSEADQALSHITESMQVRTRKIPINSLTIFAVDNST